MTSKPVDLTAKAPDRDPDLNLDQRMLLVMERIGFIPKEGVGPVAQGSYAFARVERIKDRVRDELVRAGVMLYTSFHHIDVEVIGGDKRVIKAVVQGTMQFVNVDAGLDHAGTADNDEESRTIAIAGMALDNSDKAIAKAMTSADKYGLLNAFQIPTGDDPDTEGVAVPSGNAPRPPASAQPNRPQRPAQAVSQAPAGDGDTGPAGDPVPNDDPGKCPKHHRDWKAGQYGYFCSAKDDSTERGYCILKPSKEWTAANER